jgi:hypothetical protein
MNYGLSSALAELKPAQRSSERFAQQQNQLMQLKQQFTADQIANAEAEAAYQEQLGLVQENVNLLSETGRAEMQAVIDENKELIQKELSKYGNTSQFLRNGGARMLGEYKNRILADKRFTDHKQATEGLSQIQELLAAGKGSMLSYRTLREMEQYKNGMISTFKPILVNPLTVPEKKYYEDVPIEVQSMLDENRHQIISNFIMEYPDQEITEERLFNYTSMYYGAALGAKREQAAKIAARAKMQANGKMQDDYYMFSRNTTNMFIKSRDEGTIPASGGTGLKDWIFQGGHQQAVPFNFQRKTKFETKTGNRPNEMYEMNKAFGGAVWGKFADMSGITQNEDGTYNFEWNQVYDEDGIYGGGVRVYDDYIEGGKTSLKGKFLGVYMVKGNEDVYNEGTGEHESMIFMENTKSKKKQNNLEAEYADITGHGMEVAMFRDDETGEVFYMSIPVDDAAGTGIHQEAWGKMDEIGDDIRRRQNEKAFENQVEAWDDARGAEATAIYKSKYENSINDDIAIRGLNMSTHIYGGFIAAATQANMAKFHAGAKGSQYNDLWQKTFEATRLGFRDEIDSNPELKDKLAYVNSDAEARQVLLNYIRENGQDPAVEDYYKKYINLFRN